MPQHVLPVVMPYRRDGETRIDEVQIDVIAGDAATALATARPLAAYWLRLRHPGESCRVLVDQAKVGSPMQLPIGPYLYLLTPEDHVRSVAFPSRIDNEPGEKLAEVLAALDPEGLYGVVMDCSALVYINTVGLTGIAAQVKRLRLHLCRVPDPIQKVLEIVGMMRFLHLHVDLDAALAGLVEHCRADAAPR